jgi:hypothetical protein
MRKSRFTDEQVVGIIPAAFAGQIARTAPRDATGRLGQQQQGAGLSS